MTSRVLSTGAAACALVLGCGGSGDQGAAARTPTPTTVAETTSTPSATASARGAKLRKIGDFATPVFVTAPPDDRNVQYVVEQEGRIMAVRDGRKRGTPFLDIRSEVTAGGEQGLLSMAFAPDYASSGRFYVYFTDNSGDQRVVEYKRSSGDRADAGSARLVLRMADSESNHNGGLLLFGPDDNLYIGTGDGGGAGDQHGSRGNAQNLGSLLGKILRIDPKASGGRAYTVPSGNPFVGRSGARGEIYAYGLRNPWRFSFDRRTDDLSIGDVGQNEIEEIDFVRSGRGKNFGWRPFEGRSRYASGESAPGAVKPVIERFHSRGNCSITGGVVVRDRSLGALYGRYLFGDFCRGRIESAKLSPGKARAVRTTSMKVDSLSSFGEDARGRVYAVSLERPRLPAGAALSLHEHDVARIRADNPSPYTLDGTNTWILGRDPAWVIDPGPAIDAHLDAIAAEVERRGGAGGIAVTHDHEDHVEGVAGLRERLGGPPVAAFRHPADVTLRDRSTFGPLEAILVPGHADDHLVFVADRIAFTGDAVLGQGSVFVTTRLAEYMAALERLRTRSLALICPGHGPPVEDPGAKLTEYLEHRQEREDKLVAALQAGLRTEDELLDTVWADAPPQLRQAAAVTLSAHMEKLREEGRF